MKNKVIVAETLVVAAVLIVTLLLGWFASGAILGNTALDIQLHDTYFVFKFSWEDLVLLPFLIFMMLMYSIRGTIGRFKSQTQNVILLTSIFLFNVQLLFHYKIAAKLSSLPSGWTIYPPRSALPQHNLTSHPSPSPFRGILQILFYTQIFFLVLLVIIAVLTGKNWKTNTHEAKAQ